LLSLLGAHHILNVSRIRVKLAFGAEYLSSRWIPKNVKIKIHGAI